MRGSSDRPGVGRLYIVATPIGNLDDISTRARNTLVQVDRIAAEDTRHSGRLLAHLGIDTPTLAYHEHNESRQAGRIVAMLEAGEDIALISDAGTPLVSDPGYRLVHLAREQGIPVTPIPGPSALIAALSVSGLPSDRFCFEGFLPAKSAARRKRLGALAQESRSLIIYETTNRLSDSLSDMAEVLGADRAATVARELTKMHEDVRHGTLAELATIAAEDPDLARGEAVVVVAGAESGDTDDGEVDRVLAVLLPRMSVKDAVAATVDITGAKKNAVYRRAQELGDGTGG